LATITKALPKGDVEFVADGQVVTVTAGRARFTLPLMPADEYPPLPTMPPVNGTIGADEFADAVAQVGIAAGRDDTLPMLTGIRVETDGSLLTFAATDRFRLAVRTAQWSPEVLDLVPAVLVPGRSLMDAAKGVGAGEVGLAFGDGILGVRCGNRRTTMRLLDVEFVKYRGLLPTTHTTGVDVSISELSDAIKRSALVTDSGHHLRVTITDGSLSLSAGTDTAGASEESMQVETDGADLTIAFNPTYLLDGLGVLTGDTARLEFTTPARPALLTSPADPEYRCIVMPARLPG
jgi:DNA polymerase-3 subunit beta